MRFLDQAKIYIKAGDGGAGCIAFRREKFVEFGGPNGGNGGDGGNVYFIANSSLNTLIDFRYRQHFKAPKGEHGRGYNRFGAKGQDLIIEVPIGTIIWDASKTIVLANINSVDEKILIAQAGNGGRGNQSFRSSTNQAPKIAEAGTSGEELWVWLELQLLADVGLLGFPNAGKSTLLAHVSNAKPKIADYPFSTLIPKLGVVYHKGISFTIADIPGLIEGAGEGKGLGHRFLSHINKCKFLLHLIDATKEDYFEAFSIVNKELEVYSTTLLAKPQIIVINKIDRIEAEELNEKVTALKQNLTTDYTILLISALDKNNINTLLDKTITLLQNANKAPEVKTKWSPV